MKFYHILSHHDMNGLCTEEDMEKLNDAYRKASKGTGVLINAVWHTKRREAPGIYREDSRGNLHYLGCHSPIPEEVEGIMNRALESLKP